jgi:hypothetical protein
LIGNVAQVAPRLATLGHFGFADFPPVAQVAAALFAAET